MGKASQIDLEIVREAAAVLGLAVGGGPPLSTLDTATILLQLLEDGRLLASVRNTSLLATHLALDAGILPTQLERFTQGCAIVTDPEGVLVASARTAAELDTLTGARSPLQAQIDAITVGGGGVTSVADTPTIDLVLVSGVLNAAVQPTSLSDAHIAPGAAMALSKLAALASGRAVVSDPSGFLTTGSPTSGEINCVAGATSNLQAQLNAITSSALSVTDTATLDLTLAAGNVLSGGVASGSLTDAQIAPAAAIAYGKLALAGSLVNADVSPIAAIAYSKLALAGSLVNADVAPAAAIAYSKLALTGSLVNADLAPAAAIAVSKLAALAASKAVATNASGVLTPATTTAAELDFVSGATSNLQAQLNARASLGAPAETFSVFKGSSPATVASAAGILTFNMDASNYYEVTLTENVSAIVMNNTTRAGARTLLFKQSGAGAFTVAGWPSVLWLGGSGPPTITTGAGARDFVSIIIDSSGAKHGVVAPAFA